MPYLKEAKYEEHRAYLRYNNFTINNKNYKATNVEQENLMKSRAEKTNYCQKRIVTKRKPENNQTKKLEKRKNEARRNNEATNMKTMLTNKTNEKAGDYSVDVERKIIVSLGFYGRLNRRRK